MIKITKDFLVDFSFIDKVLVHMVGLKKEALLEALKIDSLTLDKALKKGNVDFNKSETKLDSCKRYTIAYNTFEIFVENCEINATILSVNSKE